MTTDLIKRLEEATEGSFELGAEVLCRLRGIRFLSVEPLASLSNPYHMVVCAEGLGPYDRFEFYANDPTRCLTTAMKQVPDGWRFLDLTQDDGGWQAGVIKPGYETGTDGPVATGPIALCIAALKAKDQS